MKRLFSLLITFLFLFVSVGSVKAVGGIDCPNRFVTLVNPVRGRTLWSENSIWPLLQQYRTAAKYSMPVTWLIQYDALVDIEIVNTFKKFEIKGEQGVFLEVSKDLADKAGVLYQQGVKWSSPSVVFLSAYTQSERRILIDTIYDQFKKNFGYYPKSVGAWWIDSYSLNYIKEKYDLSSVLIVADQKTTDSYGVWGQWWGYPYYPSKNNVLVPGKKDYFDSVVIQWAQRDPILAYGEGPKHSNFSLQANDYIRNGRNTDYFISLVNTYLNCENKLGQVTIGMETGMEAVGFQTEYQRQLDYLSQVKGLKAITMSEFTNSFKKVYKENPNNIKIGNWLLTKEYRENKDLGDKIYYNQNTSFKDYFLPDNQDFLNRQLPVSTKDHNSFPWLFTAFMALTLVLVKLKKTSVWIPIFLFSFASLGLVLRSGSYLGWEVFYGPVVKNLTLIQILATSTLCILVFFIYIKLKRKVIDINLLLWLLPLSFGIDKLVSVLRYSVIDGGRFLGILLGTNRIFGIVFESKSIRLVNNTLPISAVSAFLKINFDKIWQNPFIYLFFYPLIHILIACVLYRLLVKLNPKFRNLILLILGALMISQIIFILNYDPKYVFPILK
jgi:hypothetical protein